jgi:hypothetical protein
LAVANRAIELFLKGVMAHQVKQPLPTRPINLIGSVTKNATGRSATTFDFGGLSSSQLFFLSTKIANLHSAFLLLFTHQRSPFF